MKRSASETAFYAAQKALLKGDSTAFRMLATDADAEVREGAINGSWSSSEISEESYNAVRDVFDAALGDPSPKVRVEACRAFDARPPPKEAVIPLARFVALMGDRDAAVRHAATWLVGRLGKSKRLDLAPFLPRFVEQLADEDDVYIHEGAAFAIKAAARRGVDIEICIPSLRRHADAAESLARPLAKGALASLRLRKKR